MAKNHHSDPSSLSDAIHKLENGSSVNGTDIREFLDKEIKAAKDAVAALQPYLDEIKDKAEVHAKKAKHEVEHKIKDNPWLAVGLVGVIAFILGWLFAFQRRDK